MTNINSSAPRHGALNLLDGLLQNASIPTAAKARLRTIRLHLEALIEREQKPAAAQEADSRARFEAWAVAQSFRASNLDIARESVVPEWYVSDITALAWRAWQSAPVAAAPADVFEAYKTWPADLRAKLSVYDLRRMNGWAPRTVVGDWRIDTSAGGPILVYKDCSVIESEDARYVLALIQKDATPAAPGIDLEHFLPHTHAVIDKMQDVMAVHGFTVPVRVISDAFRTTLLCQQRGKIDASPKGVTFRNYGDSEAQFIADEARLNCPSCGGSGHVEDSPKAGSEARDAALNTLAQMFHNGEEMEGPDGMAVSVDLALWHEALEAYEVLIGDYDEVTLATSDQAQAGDAEVQP